MEKYLQLLLIDLENAANNVPERWFTWMEQKEEADDILPYMEDIEAAPQEPLEQLCRIKQVQLPLADRLTATQIHRLLNGIRKMLAAYNCHLVFQIEVPERIQYEVVRKCWQQDVKILILNYGFFEYCHTPENTGLCSLGDYCHCKVFNTFLETQVQKDSSTFDEHFWSDYDDYRKKLDNDQLFLDDWQDWLEK